MVTGDCRISGGDSSPLLARVVSVQQLLSEDEVIPFVPPAASPVTFAPHVARGGLAGNATPHTAVGWSGAVPDAAGSGGGAVKRELLLPSIPYAELSTQQQVMGSGAFGEVVQAYYTGGQARDCWRDLHDDVTCTVVFACVMVFTALHLVSHRIRRCVPCCPLTRYLNGQMTVAVKRNGKLCADTAAIDHERELLDKLLRAPHDHVVTAFGVCVDAPDGAMRLVMRLCPLGSLDGFLQKAKSAYVAGTRDKMMSLKLVVKMAMQCCSALHHLHGMGIIHRDVRSANILLMSRKPIRVAITDFGVSHQLSRCVVGLAVRTRRCGCGGGGLTAHAVKKAPKTWLS